MPSPDLSILDGPYWRDLCDQPQALEDTLQGLRAQDPLLRLAERLRAGEFQRIVLTGMGSSYHGLHPLNLQLIHAGWGPVMVETSELVHYQAELLGSETLVVVVSQSGRSAEVVRLVEENRGRATLLALTNTENSPLAERANAAVLTRAGEEFSVSCKTYLASLVALEWLAAVLCGRDPESARNRLLPAAAAVRDYLSHWRGHVEELSGRLAGIRQLFLVGRGSSLAAVGTGALIVKESDRFASEGMSSAAFRHGPLEMLNQHTFVAVFSGPEKTKRLNRGLAEELRARGAPCALIGSEQTTGSVFSIPDLGESIRPVLEILPVQMVTLALAAAAGREPGTFAFASKITAVE